MRNIFLTVVILLFFGNSAFAEEKSLLVADSTTIPAETKQSDEIKLPPADAEGYQPLTLEEAQAIALQHYPQIASAQAATKIAEEEVNVSRSNYLPQVTGNAARVFATDDARLVATGGLNNSTVIDRGAAGVGISQLITDFGHTSDLIAAAKLDFEAQQARGNLTRDTVLLNATRAYYNLLHAQELLKVAETTLKTRKTFLDQTSSLRDAKVKSNLDFSIANQLVGEANLLLLKAKSGVDDAQAALTESLGFSEPKIFVVFSHSSITPPSDNLDDLVQQAMARNPEIATLRAEESAAKKRADAEDEGSYPTISALGYAGTALIRPDDQIVKENSAAGGINITIPFYTGGRLTAEDKQSEYKAEIAGHDLVLLKNQLMRDIRIALGNVNTSYQNITVTKDIVKNANDALDLTQERYNIGSSSIVDLSQAQLAQTEAQIEATNATYDYLIQRALLNYKIGAEMPSAINGN